MQKLKLIISGGRDFTDEARLKKELNKILEHYCPNGASYRNVEIITGGARGADSIAEKVAKEMHLPNAKFDPKWEYQGRSAGPIRNKRMADYAKSENALPVLLCFWDGQSRGTANMIKVAKDAGIATHIVNY